MDVVEVAVVPARCTMHAVPHRAASRRAAPTPRRSSPSLQSISAPTPRQSTASRKRRGERVSPFGLSTMNDLVLLAADLCAPLSNAARAEMRVDPHVLSRRDELSHADSHRAVVRPELSLEAPHRLRLQLVAQWRYGEEGPRRDNRLAHERWLHGIQRRHRRRRPRAYGMLEPRAAPPLRRAGDCA